MTPTELRFWAKVHKTDECWLWTASVNQKGYGQFLVNQRPVLAHRYSYFLATGIDPGSDCVLHCCDVQACVRPSHLFRGTRADNNADMHRKGRGGHGESYRGEKHQSAKLTEDDVREMRQLFAGVCNGHVMAAERYGVTPQNAWYVIRGRTWRHLL